MSLRSRFRRLAMAWGLLVLAYSVPLDPRVCVGLVLLALGLTFGAVA